MDSQNVIADSTTGRIADHITDRFGRRFSYLRLSVTDACNFRCAYCLPQGYQKAADAPNALSLAEIVRLVRAFAELGTRKVRLTGGEPTLRRDLAEIVRSLVAIKGIEKIALSTNGFRLLDCADELKDAGISALNVSVDTLDAEKFYTLTGRRYLEQILAGIDRCIELGFDRVKVNAVLLAGKNDDGTTLQEFKNWVKGKPVTVRFIELMPNALNSQYFATHHQSAKGLRVHLLATGWSLNARQDHDGPAEEFTHPEFVGRIGVIAPYRKDFCGTCNRLRVTSHGKLRLCLFAEGEQPLRPWLAADDQKEELKGRLLEMIGRKEISHYLPDGIYGDNRTFSAMGG